MPESPVADLHLHTTASDGTDSVAARLQQATERGLEAIAITDHDTVEASLPARSMRQGGVEIVTGVEVRADCLDTKVELLGYYIDPDAAPLTTVLERVRGYRHERNEAILKRLETATGAAFDYETVSERSHGVLGRPHIASELVDRGLVDSVGDAFAEYLGEGGEAFVPMERVPAAEVIDAIHAAGGVVSLAHPGRIRSDRVPEMVDRLVGRGLDGIEVWYPYGGSGPDAYADIGVEAAAELAAEHGLLPTGGSDCHGTDSGKFRIGEVGMGADAFERLTRAARDRHPA